MDPRLSQNFRGSWCGSSGVSMRDVSREPMNTGMNRRGWSALLLACRLHEVGTGLQVGDHELVEFDAFNRLQVSLD
jgi:hypothetical protein